MKKVNFDRLSSSGRFECKDKDKSLITRFLQTHHVLNIIKQACLASVRYYPGICDSVYKKEMKRKEGFN